MVEKEEVWWRWRDDVEFSPSKITTTTQLLIILQLLLHIPHQHIPEAMVSRLHARVPIFLTRSSEIAHILVSLSHRQATIPVPCLPCVLKTSKIRTYEQ